MNKKNFLIILFSSIGLLAVVVILYFVIPKQPEEKPIVYSDDYLANAEIFNFSLSADGNSYAITGLKAKHQKDTIITVPETIDNIPVTKIIGDQGNFSSWKNVYQIVISKNIEYIGTDVSDIGYLKGGSYGSSIFIASDTNLREFVVSEDNQTYSSVDGVLYNKDKTILLRYPNGKTGDSATLRYEVMDGVTEIYEKAFYMNKMLVSLMLPDSVTTIDSQAFYKCNNLKTLVLSKNLLSISTSAFFECALENVEIPDGVLEIRGRAFGYNAGLEYVYIPSSVVSVGTNCFTNCPRLVIYTESGNVDKLRSMDSLKNEDIRAK